MSESAMETDSGVDEGVDVGEEYVHSFDELDEEVQERVIRDYREDLRARVDDAGDMSEEVREWFDDEMGLLDVEVPSEYGWRMNPDELEFTGEDRRIVWVPRVRRCGKDGTHGTYEQVLQEKAKRVPSDELLEIARKLQGIVDRIPARMYVSYDHRYRSGPEVEWELDEGSREARDLEEVLESLIPGYLLSLLLDEYEYRTSEEVAREELMFVHTEVKYNEKGERR